MDLRPHGGRKTQRMNMNRDFLRFSLDSLGEVEGGLLPQVKNVLTSKKILENKIITADFSYMANRIEPPGPSNHGGGHRPVRPGRLGTLRRRRRAT